MHGLDAAPHGDGTVCVNTFVWKIIVGVRITQC